MEVSKNWEFDVLTTKNPELIPALHPQPYECLMGLDINKYKPKSFRANKNVTQTNGMKKSMPRSQEEVF